MGSHVNSFINSVDVLVPAFPSRYPTIDILGEVYIIWSVGD